MGQTLPDGDQQIEKISPQTDEGRVEFGGFGPGYSEKKQGFGSSLLDGLRSADSSARAKVGAVLGVIVVCFLMLGATAFFATSWMPTGLQVAHYGPNSNLPANANNNNANSDTDFHSAAPTPTPVLGRPDSGFILSHAFGSGQGRLDVSNGLKEDAIVKLRDAGSGQSYREIYIRAGENATSTEIAPGSYEIIFALGRNYAPSVKKFLDDASFKKFDAPFDFSQSPAYKISLSKQPSGKPEPSITDEADFNR